MIQTLHERHDGEYRDQKVPYSLEGPSWLWSLCAGGSTSEAVVMSLCLFCLALLSSAEPLLSTFVGFWLRPLLLYDAWSPLCE